MNRGRGGRGRGRGRGRGQDFQEQPPHRKAHQTPAKSSEARTEEVDEPDQPQAPKVASPVQPTPATQTGQLVKAIRPRYSKSMVRQIELISNLFRLKCTRKCFYHYDVSIVPLDQRGGSKKFPQTEPKQPGKEYCQRILFELIKRQKHLGEYMPIYDGQKNVFTCEPLPIKDAGECFEVPVTFDGREKRYQVAIKPVVKKTGDNIISLQSLDDYVRRKNTTVPNEIRMVMDTILAFRPLNSSELKVRNAFFSASARTRVPLGGGYELALGYNQTVTFTEQGAAVIINVAAAAFHKSGPVLSIVTDLFPRLGPLQQRTFLNKGDVVKLEKHLHNIRVQVVHQKYKRKYYIQGLADPANRQTFDLKVGDEVQKPTVEHYFRDAYGVLLRYPNLPCLHMRSSNKMVFIPMEVCEVLDGQRVSKLDAKGTANMIRQAAMPPNKRFSKIEGHAQEIRSNVDRYMSKYGLEFSLNPIEVVGRVLETPAITYTDNKSLKPNKGAWDMRDKGFSTPANAKRWMIASFADPERCSMQKLKYFADLMRRNGNRCGLFFGEPKIFTVGGRTSTEEIIQRAKDDRLDLLVFVISDRDQYHSYAEIKFLGDIKHEVTTQVINESVITGKRLNDQVASNVCLKINTKLGGVNHILSEWPLALHRESVILFGSDVVHNVGAMCPSIAAVVGSINIDLTQYAVSCRAQRNVKGSLRSQEIIIDLKEMVRSILISHYRSTKRKPQKILFYRDGVSEGQFDHVLQHEIPMIKDACKSLESTYMPPITFVVVQKRHQVRLRPKYEEDGVGRAGNVPPGTTVDTTIVNPQNYDFYLCSHEGIQGTSRPAHYTVLFDENKVTPEAIEKLSFFLCHVFARSNRSISIPAPVKYADRLAYRASHYVQYKMSSERHRLSKYSEDEVPEEIQQVVKSIDEISTKMFYV